MPHRLYYSKQSSVQTNSMAQKSDHLLFCFWLECNQLSISTVWDTKTWEDSWLHCRYMAEEPSSTSKCFCDTVTSFHIFKLKWEGGNDRHQAAKYLKVVARFVAMASDQQSISGLNKLKLTCDHFTSCIYRGGSLVNDKVRS